MATLPMDAGAASALGGAKRQPADKPSRPSPPSSTSPIRTILSMPPRWLRMYGEFIAKNQGQVSQIESTLRSLTYIIPGRFRDAEIAAETLHSGIQLLSLYHDLLLQRASSPPSSPTSSQQLPPLPHRTMHARYTAFWSAKSPLYRRVALALQVVQHTQLLIEMTARRRGDDRLRWRVVVLVEAFKAFCRLLLLRVTRARPLLQPALPERAPVPPEQEDDDEDGAGFRIPEEFRDDDELEADFVARHGGDGSVVLNDRHPRRRTNGSVGSAKKPSPSLSSSGEWHMPRTNSSLPPLPSNADISSYLLSRVLTADDIKPAPRLLRPLAGAAHAAEVLHIVAPLVYAIALAYYSLRRGGKQKSSWTPWLLGLALSVAARRLRDRGLRATALEREEWARRGWALGWWAMRGAAYEGVVKGVVEGVKRRMPGFVGGVISDYEYLWENYYFSTAD